MLSKRIIPCLDIKDGRTVKGTNFVNLRDAGDPVELAAFYANEGADELVFLDITATHEGRKTFADLVSRIAERINIPFTVGGGISSVDDVKVLLDSGADKVSVNSSAVRNPQLIADIATTFGSQCVVVAIDAKNIDGRWVVHLNGGRIPVDLELYSWAKKAQELGAGEVLFTSMDNDGVHKGYANEALAILSDLLTIPVVASGGAGSMMDFYNAFTKGKANAALAAGVFHFGEINIPGLKQFLSDMGIPMRTSITSM